MIAPWYAMAYTHLDRIAHRHGYALALHGSMARDLDLIAVPWTEDADPPEKLLKAFIRFITTRAEIRYDLPPPTQKPHGRIAYALPIGFDGHYLDISVLPRKEKYGTNQPTSISRNGRPLVRKKSQNRRARKAGR